MKKVKEKGYYLEYSQPVIKGKMPKTVLPEGTALVLEGGGIRGYYSAGVFEAFMDAGILFPYIVSVSASSANAIPYIAGQQGRNRQVAEHYAADPRYVGIYNLLFHRSLFGMEFVFHEIPQKHVYVDWEMFYRQNIRFLTGALNCNNGRTAWFEKDDIDPQMIATMASCSIPFLSPIVKFKGNELLDGGMADPIPIEKSIADGNTFHVVVLTQNAGYRKRPFIINHFAKWYYRAYPKVADAIIDRHTVYNRQVDLCRRLEQEGKAVIIQPKEPLRVGRAETNTKKILALYDEGHREGHDAIDRIIRR